MRMWTCGECGRQCRPLWLIDRQWLCLSCIDPAQFTDMRIRVRFLQLRAAATMAEIRERRGEE